jgi:hypothetical protein
MQSDRPDPKRNARQFTIGALFVWIVLLSVSLTFAKYAIETQGVLLVIALQSLGASIGAPFGYLFGEDRITGSIFGALVGGAIGMLVALLVMPVLVMVIVS